MTRTQAVAFLEALKTYGKMNNTTVEVILDNDNRNKATIILEFEPE